MLRIQASRGDDTWDETHDDIFTEDALAWAYFKAGRIEDARRTILRASRTGSRDRDILRHAAAIAAYAPALMPPPVLRVAAR